MSAACVVLLSEDRSGAVLHGWKNRLPTTQVMEDWSSEDCIIVESVYMQSDLCPSVETQLLPGRSTWLMYRAKAPSPSRAARDSSVRSRYWGLCAQHGKFMALGASMPPLCLAEAVHPVTIIANTIFSLGFMKIIQAVLHLSLILRARAHCACRLCPVTRAMMLLWWTLTADTCRSRTAQLLDPAW